MRLHLAFGKTGLPVDLPPGLDYQVLEARSATPLADPSAALEDALDHPVGLSSLIDMARGKLSAAISVCGNGTPMLIGDGLQISVTTFGIGWSE